MNRSAAGGLPAGGTGMGAHSTQSSEFCCELTNSSHLPGNGVGQYSAAGDLTTSPRLLAGSHCCNAGFQCARQMSRLPSPPSRVDMKYRYCPSGDSIGQPSAAAVLTPGAGTGSCQAP